MQFWARVLVSLVAILLICVIVKWYNQPALRIPSPEAFHTGALEEARAQYELGLRTGAFGPHPTPNGCPRPAASVEAQGLQRAGGLAPGAPYYTIESPATTDYVTDSGPIITDQHDDRSVDSFGARRLVRDHAQFGSILSRRNAVMGTSGAQISAREARSNSARDGFGEYPTAAWAGGEGAQSPKTPASAHSCVDNCVGDLCAAHCAM
jgi:hypothetical protein